MTDARVPRTRVAKLDAAGCELTGPALLCLVGGELVARSWDAPEVVRIQAGDALSVPAGRRAHCASRSGCAEVMVLELDPEWSASVLALAAIPPPPAVAAFFVERAGSQAARSAARLLQRLSDPGAGPGPGARLRAAALAVEALSLAFAERGAVLEIGSRRSAGQGRRRRFHVAVEALAAGDLDGLSLDGFARGLEVSARQASRLFREELGCTFREHVANLRIERARRLLAETERSIVDVAGETGWSSLAHFNSAFRRWVGATPSAYRHRSRRDPADARLCSAR
jgi:AraC-like DNA-binding protein